MEPSAAHAFFVAHKDLFEYDKHVGGQDFFQPESIHGQGNSSSFLDRYRELDRNRPPVAEMPFTLRHSSRSRYPLDNHAMSTTATTSSPAPEFVTLQSTAAITTHFSSPQQARNHPSAFATSPQRAIHHTQQQQMHSPLSTYDTMQPLQHAGAQHVSASTTLIDGHKSPNPLSSPKRHHSPVKSSVESGPKRGVFCMPKLAELLIGREARATAIPHKFLDEAHKIEVLIGGKCVGRVSAVSRNIPPSIRTRLQASAIVSVRRERLYDLLRRDYEDLNGRCT